jgi:hypothetical protein
VRRRESSSNCSWRSISNITNRHVPSAETLNKLWNYFSATSRAWDTAASSPLRRATLWTMPRRLPKQKSAPRHSPPPTPESAPSTTQAYARRPKTNTIERMIGRKEETQRKPRIHIRFSLCSFSLKLTKSICRMLWLAETEASSDGLSIPVTRRHVSSESPSSCLLSLCDHSRLPQAWRAFRFIASSGARVPRTQVFIPMPPNFMGEGRMGQLGLRDIHAVISR